MVKIRLTRTGRKLDPTYRIVVADSRFPRDGRFIEQVGFYDPKLDEAKGLVLKEDRILEWLNKGAAPSDTVKSLLARHGVWKKFIDSKKGE